MQMKAPKPAEPRTHAVATPSALVQRATAETTFVDNRPEALRHRELQEMMNSSPRVTQFAAQRAPGIDATGLPYRLKAGVEALSGITMDHVKVHYNSGKPAQLNAHAYTQGGDIHVGPGQEPHLPHEAWHVVQQAQGRVRPTFEAASGVPINDDRGLEAEADVMGARAAHSPARCDGATDRGRRTAPGHAPSATAQLRKLNMDKKTLANLPNALKNKVFAQAIATLYEAHGEAKVLYLAGQLFSAEGEDIASLDQFMIELGYDLATKASKDGDLTLQEQYMTEYGWKRAAKNARPKAAEWGGLKLKLYRTMSVADWKKLFAGDASVLQGGHIGDFKQALKYFMGSSTDAKVMVEFTLKAGSEETLFSTRVAMPKQAERTTKLKTMATAMGGAHGVFPVCSKSEGTSSDAIGLKSESEGEAGFSIGIGGGGTAAEFMALVESVSVTPVGDRASAEPSSSASASRNEADARLLLGVNNCLINAIALAARGNAATLPELTAIRGAMNNAGEMLLATPAVVDLIRQHLGVANPITVHYDYPTPDEDFDGVGAVLEIHHVNGNHFTHIREED